MGIDFTEVNKQGQYFCQHLVQLCYFQDANISVNRRADVCSCLSLFNVRLTFVSTGVSLALVLSQLSRQPVEESRPLLETCKVKDFHGCVAGNMRVNTPDTDTFPGTHKRFKQVFWELYALK